MPRFLITRTLLQATFASGQPLVPIPEGSLMTLIMTKVQSSSHTLSQHVMGSIQEYSVGGAKPRHLLNCTIERYVQDLKCYTFMPVGDTTQDRIVSSTPLVFSVDAINAIYPTAERLSKQL